ncbi:hypothetical protein K227x_42840 [Rubripirellula lacrimiformis]|uniref:Uncharacterized protein n=1 Tax=Rubripirellula lacrimiformis TaxID=1930273 RepID=A0A517NFG7_9BACT|nr:hypothetical protein K227x_42840 [Rubripirellula lacrimiformis]
MSQDHARISNVRAALPDDQSDTNPWNGQGTTRASARAQRSVPNARSCEQMIAAGGSGPSNQWLP